MDAVKKLTKINTRLAAARQALRAVTEEERSALAEVKTAEAALADHFGQEDHDPLPSDLRNQLAAARNRAEQPWRQRREGKQRLVGQLEAERARVRPRTPWRAGRCEGGGGTCGDRRVIEALESIEGAVREWRAVAHHYSDLLRPVEGVDGRDVPELYIDAVRLEAARAPSVASRCPCRGRSTRQMTPIPLSAQR